MSEYPKGFYSILGLDALLLAIVPLGSLIMYILSGSYFAGVAYFVWYSPLTNILGYFLGPFEFLIAPTGHVLMLVAVVFTALRDIRGLMALLALIAIQSGLAMLGLAYYTSNAYANEYMVEAGIYTRNLALMWTRGIFSILMISMNLWFFLRPNVVKAFRLRHSAATRAKRNSLFSSIRRRKV